MQIVIGIFGGQYSVENEKGCSGSRVSNSVHVAEEDTFESVMLQGAQFV